MNFVLHIESRLKSDTDEIGNELNWSVSIYIILYIDLNLGNFYDYFKRLS